MSSYLIELWYKLILIRLYFDVNYPIAAVMLCTSWFLWLLYLCICWMKSYQIYYVRYLLWKTEPNQSWVWSLNGYCLFEEIFIIGCITSYIEHNFPYDFHNSHTFSGTFLPEFLIFNAKFECEPNCTFLVLHFFQQTL